MTEQDSTCVCQVCGTTYSPTLNSDGSRRKTKFQLCADQRCRSALARGVPLSGVRERSSGKVEKACACCGKVMFLIPSVAKKRSACSMSCASLLKARAKGYSHRTKHIVCAFCASEVTVTAWKNQERVRFCSVKCRALLSSKVAYERNALRRIADRIRAKPQSAVRREILALRRIARSVREQGRCRHCDSLYVRKQRFQRYCSSACRGAASASTDERYKSSELCRAARRRGKSKRRAVIRGCAHESIDPIKVFERDKWRCHLCGVKTPRSLRGTTDDRAPELEHIVSLADGGSHTWGNVACSCRKCNISKGSASFGQLGLGFAA